MLLKHPSDWEHTRILLVILLAVLLFLIWARSGFAGSSEEYTLAVCKSDLNEAMHCIDLKNNQIEVLKQKLDLCMSRDNIELKAGMMQPGDVEITLSDDRPRTLSICGISKNSEKSCIVWKDIDAALKGE